MNQYIGINWRRRPVASPLSRRLSAGGAARAPKRVPRHAGKRVCRSVAAATAADARTLGSSQGGRNRHRKKIRSDYPRGVRNPFTGGGFPLPDALPVAPALSVSFLFSRLRASVLTLGLPPRPFPRLLPALAAAVALPPMLRTEALFASFEQTLPRARCPPPPLPPPRRLLFAMVCRIFKKAHGRSCSQKLLPRWGF